jgi:hypothetical protein
MRTVPGTKSPPWESRNGAWTSTKTKRSRVTPPVSELTRSSTKTP